MDSSSSSSTALPIIRSDCSSTSEDTNNNSDDYMSLLGISTTSSSSCHHDLLSPNPLKPEELDSLANGNIVFLVPIDFTQNIPPQLPYYTNNNNHSPTKLTRNGKVRKKSRWDVVSHDEPDPKEVLITEEGDNNNKSLNDSPYESYEIILVQPDEGGNVDIDVELGLDTNGVVLEECNGTSVSSNYNGSSTNSNGGHYYYGTTELSNTISINEQEGIVVLSEEDILNNDNKNVLILDDDGSKCMNHLLVHYNISSHHNNQYSSFANANKSDTDRIFADIDVGATETVHSHKMKRLSKRKILSSRSRSSSTNRSRGKR